MNAKTDSNDKKLEQSDAPITIVRAGDCFTDTTHGFTRFWGVSRRLSGSKGISMGYGKLDVGKQATAHCHDVETAIRILRGAVRVRFGKGLALFVDVSEGDFIYIPPMVQHSPEVIGNMAMEYVVSRNSPEED